MIIKITLSIHVCTYEDISVPLLFSLYLSFSLSLSLSLSFSLYASLSLFLSLSLSLCLSLSLSLSIYLSHTLSPSFVQFYLLIFYSQAKFTSASFSKTINDIKEIFDLRLKLKEEHLMKLKAENKPRKRRVVAGNFFLDLLLVLLLI